MRLKTVHIVLNAHLDPVWLWSWRAGLDEVLNTSHAICDLLDRHPEIVYTRGEAWLYEQIQRVDPELFARIKTHIEAGRWSTVGGWYLQPDCNLPSGTGMRRQIALGKKYFERELGEFPGVAYNVDSFGHAASLPGLMREAGQAFYVMMRPQEHELVLPSRLFRWRGYAEGPEVTVFRISGSYGTFDGNLTEANIRAALVPLPEGIDHTMFFAGIGDHGGGPNEQIISWIKEHREKFDGIRLEFSSPARFFAAVQGDVTKLPLVVGELQHHAVGCYSVHRAVKLKVKQAEHLLEQAELAAGAEIGASSESATRIEKAWERVCFHHFHDTIGGTCIPAAYPEVDHQLGEALAAADEISAYDLRRRMIALPLNAAQRLVFYNASRERFDNFTEVEPWLDGTAWAPTWRLVDEADRMAPFQVMAPDCGGEWITKLLVPLDIGPGETRILRIVESGEMPAASPADRETQVKFNIGENRSMQLPGLDSWPLPELATYEDVSDTWSHGVSRYPRKNRETVTWRTHQTVDQGPLMASVIEQGVIGRSRVQMEWRTYRDRPWLDCLLRVDWCEELRILKFEWNLPGGITEREDGIMDGSLRRGTDGAEFPLRDWTRLRVARGGTSHDLGIVAPDVFALDATAGQIGFTLLRGCAMAHHDPAPHHPREVFADRGEHFFRFRFLAGAGATATALENLASSWNKPLLYGETTRGMKSREGNRTYRPPRLA